MQDILLDDSGDLATTNDFVAGQSDLQHAQLLLATSEGDWKSAPETGVGLRRYAGAPLSQNNMLATIKSEFALDGLTVQVTQSGQTIDIALTLNSNA